MKEIQGKILEGEYLVYLSNPKAGSAHMDIHNKGKWKKKQTHRQTYKKFDI